MYLFLDTYVPDQTGSTKDENDNMEPEIERIPLQSSVVKVVGLKSALQPAVKRKKAM